MTVLHAALDAVHAGTLVRRAMRDERLVLALQRAAAVDILAVGKAAGAMVQAFAMTTPVPARQMVAIGPRATAHADDALPAGTEWHDAGHPLPNEGSVSAARRALALADGVAAGDLMLVLLSGGGSALMSLPAGGLTLADKQRAIQTLMEHGADIYELNTVRKHLSAVKGGQLAAMARGEVVTLAVSDVVGDDVSVIASGPTVADPSTFGEALEVLLRRGGLPRYPAPVVDRLRAGLAGGVQETPKPDDVRLARARVRVIGPQRGAIEGARRAAASLGYAIHVIAEPVTGEARVAGAAHIGRVAEALAEMPRPACVISSGETTVTVVGAGRGGRNQEFALAMAGALPALGDAVAAASIGTDGIDGPTDAAGAMVDAGTLARAAAAGLAPPQTYLSENNTYAFFDSLGDLIRTGPTSTNVGDLQVVLVA